MNASEIIRNLRTDLNPATERGQLIRSAGVSAMLHAGSIAIAFAASLLYARTLGPHGYGAFATVIAWSSLLALPAGLGLPQYLLRETARTPRPVQPLQMWADTRVLIASLIAASLMVLSGFVLENGALYWLFIAAAPLPFLNNLGDIRQARVQAGGWAARSQVAHRLLTPVTTLVIVLFIWWISGSLSPMVLVWATLASSLLPIGVNQGLLWRFEHQADVKTYQETADSPLRIRSALPFMALGVTDFINKRIDLIMISIFLGSYDAGIFAIAARAAETVPLVLIASNTTVASRCARLYHTGEITQLQRLITGAIRRVGLITMPFAIILMIAAGPLLGFVYGSAFQHANVALAILVAGQLVAVWAGPNGLLLMMLGSEKAATRFLVISTFVNVVLNAIAVPFFGIIGAASATACAMIVLNLLRSTHLKRVYGIRSDFFV